MRYIKWVLLGIGLGLLLAYGVTHISDLAARFGVLAGLGGASTSLLRFVLSLLKVDVNLVDAPEGKLIRVIDLPGAIGKYLVCGVWLIGANLYLGYVEFR